MAILYITEYAELATPAGGRVSQTAMELPITSQVAAIGGSSVQSAAFNAKTRLVRLHSDVAAEVRFGTNPTATLNTSARMAAGQTEYRAVPLGQSFKVAVIAPTI